MLLALFLSFLTLFTLCAGQANPISKPIVSGRSVNVRRFARIPNFNGSPPKIQGITNRGTDLYVTTGTSGGLIYKVTKSGQVSLWFNVAQGMQANGQQMDFTQGMHGGLRAVAFHPAFNRNGLFYVSCMIKRVGPPSNFQYLSRPSGNQIPADSIVLEWKYDFTKNEVDVGSYREVVRIGMPVYDHPIKQMVFLGRFLYISHGDGSVQSAQFGGGLNNDGLGKILRINPRKRKNGRPYGIPKSNPFRNTNNFPDEVYAVGFRNPHNLCFSKSGELFVAETGRDNVEEINIVKAGGSYGWPEREGIFVHKKFPGGLVTGVGPLPPDDAKNNYIYPVAVVGHTGPVGAGFVGQAIAGSCPVENGSDMDGTLFYGNFPTDGNLYYSFLSDMRNAKTTGPPSQLTQATTYMARILFDHDNNPSTPPLNLPNIREVIRKEPGFGSANRADVRFGRGNKGQIYFSSKTVGWIYEITSTVK